MVSEITVISDYNIFSEYILHNTLLWEIYPQTESWLDYINSICSWPYSIVGYIFTLPEYICHNTPSWEVTVIRADSTSDKNISTYWEFYPQDLRASKDKQFDAEYNFPCVILWAYDFVLHYKMSLYIITHIITPWISSTYFIFIIIYQAVIRSATYVHKILLF